MAIVSAVFALEGATTAPASSPMLPERRSAGTTSAERMAAKRARDRSRALAPPSRSGRHFRHTVTEK